MKLLLPALVLLGLAIARAMTAGEDPGVVVVIGGDTLGYLSPCGCTKPMSGGIRRRATAIRALTHERKSVILENGGLVKGESRQDEMKAETLAETLADLPLTALHLTSAEAKLGKGAWESLARLSGAKLVCGHLTPQVGLVSPIIVKHGLAITGISSRAAEIGRGLGVATSPAEDAIEALLFTPNAAPVVLLEGDEDEARKLARAHPELKLIVYQADGDPPKAPLREGPTTLVTPGERGKYLVKLVWRDGAFSEYASIDLGPAFSDDPHAARAYERYLGRVTDEKLLDRLPRTKTPGFAGTKTCGSCHSDAHKVWEGTAHAGALSTLEKDKHDRDPDCVGCHVVGLSSESGFRDRLKTPALADVGCESCHGPSAEHAANPYEAKLKPAGEASCKSCHVPDHSPEFDFAKYWEKIKH
ncbi:MAG: cytochrome c family protein [Methanoregulaceae archaeon]|nr:cytochrome c family protein [Methanoregulaceae archaeon]